MSEPIPEAVEELLTSGAHIAHLATSYDDRPHVAPVWYNLHDGQIEVVITGQKLDNIRKNPRVAMSVQEDDGGVAKWGVTLRGTATIVEDEHTGKRMTQRINRRYGADDDAWGDNTPVRIDVGSASHWGYD